MFSLDCAVMCGGCSFVILKTFTPFRHACHSQYHVLTEELHVIDEWNTLYSPEQYKMSDIDSDSESEVSFYRREHHSQMVRI